MKDKNSYYYKNMPNERFGVDLITSGTWETGNYFKEHWHEHLQIFYILHGKAMVRVNMNTYYVDSKDIIVINTKELHYIESKDNNLKFYILRIDIPFLFSNQIDLCQTKYLSPLSNNLIIFKNLIKGNPNIDSCINSIINELTKKELGYEIATKGYLYQFVTLLLRNYIDKFMTEKELQHKVNNFNRFNKVFEYIDFNYNKKITLSTLSKITNISNYYFSRLFKELTGKTIIEYINEI